MNFRGQQTGFSVIEFILVALTIALLMMIIMKSYGDAVLAERRSLAHQGLFTVAGLQERWFVRKYEYARTIDDVGGADVGGDYYQFHVTQDPCGDTSCFTITATFYNLEDKDPECERITLNNQGVKKAFSWDNRDTTDICWKI